jgi:hypothetical protein
VFVRTPPSSVGSPCFPRLDRSVPLWCHGLRQIPGPLGVPFILALQQILHIYQCKLYASSSEGVGVRGTTTISGTLKDIAVVAAAAACPTVE